MVVHNGSAFGTQHTAFWVQRLGAPVCNAAIRGDNFSTGATSGLTPSGVMGVTVAGSTSVGVLGAATGTSNLFLGETGVMGITNSFGVIGKSLTGLIVNDEGSFVSGTGVIGQCDAGVGVHGIATSGWGIIGQSVARAGVTGKSVTGVGVEARSDQSNGLHAAAQSGVGVLADSVTGIGVVGRTQRGWAGYFVGNVYVRGAFYVFGGPKSAAVQHPDGTQRSLFCLESPESYFEDFGEVALTEASVVVNLDKDFAALVKRNNYQVFLTSYGPEALYVRKRGPEGFEIARVDSGAGGKPRKMRVGYRIVARRADLKPERLPKIKLPAQVAEEAMPDLTHGKARRKRAAGLAPLGKLDPLPATPKIPSPDLKAIARAKPVEAKRKG
jgi:hypothetical protein